jgi:hypothetical protein
VTDNQLAELARQQGVKQYQAPSDMVIHGEDGAPVAAEEDQEMERLFKELLCQARDTAAAGGAPDESLGAALDRLLGPSQGGASHTPAQRQVAGGPPARKRMTGANLPLRRQVGKRMGCLCS